MKSASAETGVREHVFETLASCGVKRNTGDFRDYERAKRILLPPTRWHEHYDETIRAIMDYTGV